MRVRGVRVMGDADEATEVVIATISVDLDRNRYSADDKVQGRSETTCGALHTLQQWRLRLRQYLEPYNFSFGSVLWLIYQPYCAALSKTRPHSSTSVIYPSSHPCMV